MARTKKQTSDRCAWWEDREMWVSSCGEAAFQFTNEDGPTKNGFKFCPHCGRKLVEAK